MIRPSCAMLLAALALLMGGANADANVAQGAGVYDNAANAKALLAKAVPLDGTYTITSSSTGKSLTYLHDSQPNMYPASGSVEAILNALSGSVEHPVASQTFGLSSFDDGTTRIRFDDADKCLSCQWNFEWGIDTYGVAYTCAVGSGATSDTGLRDAKQQFLFIEASGKGASSSGAIPKGGSWNGSPQSDDGWAGNDHTGSGSSSSGSEAASAGGSSSSSSGSSSGAKCEKDPGWIWRHPVESMPDFYRVHPECVGTGEAPPCLHDTAWLHEHSGYMDNNAHPECDDVFAGKTDTNDDKYTSKRSSLQPAAAHRRRRLAKQQEKRGKVVGEFYIVLLDHLMDMRTRAVSAKETTAFADAKGAWLDLFDEDDADLIWTITEA